MKFAGKLLIVLLLAALILVPFQAAQAKGQLDGGQVIFGDNYTLKSGETLGGDLVVFGGTITIEKDAKVDGSIILFGGSLSIDGAISQDVVVFGGAVKLAGNTHIYGNLVTIGAPVDRDAGAKVDGEVVNNPPRPSISVPGTPSAPIVPTINRVFDPLWSTLNILGQSLMLALLAMLLALFLPAQMRRVADGVVTQPAMSFGMGLLTLILFIVAVVALALFSIFIITLFVTVPLIFIVSVLFTAGCVFGWLALGAEVGMRISKMVNQEWSLPLAAGLGMFLLNLVAQGVAFVIPCIGGLLSGALAFAGLGAVFITRFGTRPALLTATPVAVAVPPAAPGESPQ